jgi:secreted PhoX family phosphatase
VAHVPDGGGTFAALGGGWYLVSNSERAAGAGGVSVIRFASDGTITEAGQLLGATTLNCSGGVTPWGTYLSCEEFEGGNVWEVDPTGVTPPVRRPLLGTFQHEAACVDPVRQHVYLTEDKSDGCLYRFRPTAYPDLSAGVLEVAIVAPDSTVTWQPVPDPAGAPTPTRKQVAGATVCNGGEGMWYDDGVVYFTTKGDRRVWMYHAATGRIEILYDLAKADADTPLRDVDNCVVSKSGDLFICEDGDNLEICMITPDRYISAFLRLDGVVHNGPAGPSSNETTGVVFDPSGTRMYFAAQRSFGGGAIYEVSGPFRLTRPAAPVTPVNRPVTPPPAEPVATDPPAPTPPAPVAPDTARPVVSVQSLARTLKMRAFLDRGLSVQFAISEPAGIELELRAPGFGVVARQRTTSRSAGSCACGCASARQPCASGCAGVGDAP